MDRNEKRLQKSIFNRRTPEEQKRLKEHARQRKQGRGTKRRDRTDWSRKEDADDGLEPTFEPIRAARRLDESQRRPKGPEDSAPRPAVAGASGESPAPEAGAGLTVVSIGRDSALLREDGVERRVALGSAFRLPGAALPAAGDQVHVECDAEGEERVVALLPRRSVLSRPDPGDARRERVIAANVDLGIVVLSAAGLKPRLIDRFLLALGRGGIETAVCVNKLDLVDDAARGRVERELEPYRDLCAACVLVSAESGEGLAALRSALAGRTSVLVGHSGVGKSSLVNALRPEAELSTGAVRESDGKGRHTTSAAQRVELPELGAGTALIDTPGVRAFGLWDLERATLREHFPELVERAPACRFGDCLHHREPHCAVIAAVEAGELPRSRYETYLRILADL